MFKILVSLERIFRGDSRTILRFENEFTAFEKTAKVEHMSVSAKFCCCGYTLNGEQLALVFVCF
jgi:hypothetical protein